ncbi:MAG: Gfo/Idh/MocA family oxidoreductase [bacterium]|nr:Gfo/Idh/MocA family oxidoreductase [bacterium]
MSERLRVAVVGLGVGIQHLAAWKQIDDLFEVVAVCDIDEAKARLVAEKLEIPRVETSYESLLAGDEAPDIVDICSPPHLHFEMSVAALQSGRHVVCEKPLVPSLAACDELIRIEATARGRLMPIFQYRFGNGLRKLQHLIARGLTGRAYLSTIETAWLRGDAYYAVDWRGKWETELGGVMTTHAIHSHDILCSVIGPVAGVFARATTRVNPIQTEDCAAVSLEMEDGSLATLSATLGSRPEVSRLRFSFENLTAESSHSPYHPSADPWLFTGADKSLQKEIDAAITELEPGRELYAGQFEHFHAALSSGKELPVTMTDARASLELLTAIYSSAQTGQPVALPIASDHPNFSGWLPH